MGIRIFRAAAFLCAIALGGTAHADATIDTTLQPSAGVAAGFGRNSSGAATFGQLFTAQSGNTVLNGFSMYLWAANGSVDFRSYIMEWDGDGVIGPILYHGDPHVFSTAASDPGGSQNAEFSYETGGLTLDAGKTYVALISTLERTLGGTAEVPLSFPAVSGTGGWVYTGTANSMDELSTALWRQMPTNDLWFKANFAQASSVPEPEAYAMLLAGLGLVGWAATRRSRIKS
jgi:hypothetical protein